ncbi:hypothetical protein IMSAGC004_02982 [Bacteroidaceae bacterium]|nr:hypothetical protein IMSAGC004_02982 [Bacteroidaceae bacterium]
MGGFEKTLSGAGYELVEIRSNYVRSGVIRSHFGKTMLMNFKQALVLREYDFLVYTSISLMC